MAFVVAGNQERQGSSYSTLHHMLRLPYNLYVSISRLNNITKRNMSGHVHNTNKACCSIPPVQSEYKPKGSYQKVGSFEKAYVVSTFSPLRAILLIRHSSQIGDSKTHALICIYDIFGFWPQTEQGADILSSTLSGTKVVMPDFLQGNPWPVDQFPPKTDEQKEKLQQFFGTT